MIQCFFETPKVHEPDVGMGSKTAKIKELET